MNDKENCAEKRGKQYRSDRASPSFFRRFIFLAAMWKDILAAGCVQYTI